LGTGDFARPALLARSGDLGLDLLRLGLFGVGQMHAEHAVFELGADLLGAGIIRERETAPEAPVAAFEALLPVGFLLILEGITVRNCPLDDLSPELENQQRRLTCPERKRSQPPK
jgi:hypothetical protein